MSEFRDTNGLTAGLIPAGKPCPFLDKCKLKVHTCPGVDGKTRLNNFSCAAARLHSAIAEAKDAPGFQAMARNIVEKGHHPEHFEIPRRRFSWGGFPATPQPKEEGES